MEGRVITADDVVAAGTCASGVYDWLAALENPPTVLTFANAVLLTEGTDAQRYVIASYGYGYGDGYGNNIN